MKKPSKATATRLAQLTPEQRSEVLAGLSAQELSALEYEWSFWARPDQLPPPPPWRTWLYSGARGIGKTRTAAEWVRSEVVSSRGRQMGIIAPTADSLRRICIEGPSGILSVGAPAVRTVDASYRLAERRDSALFQRRGTRPAQRPESRRVLVR